tara:strand:+ start:3719 stop:5806 length:2088 start_codon:yes stop_codon:yes gene_type:complete
MSRVRQYQSNFTIGEIDPLLRGRVDIEQYYSSVEKAKNVIFEPQGGFSRRPGLRYIADYTSSIGVTGAIRLIPFEYSSGQTYLLVFTLTSATNLRMFVYKDGVQQTNLNSSGNAYVDHTLYQSFTATNLRGLSYTQNADTMILTHRATLPFTVVRGAGDTNWTVAGITFEGRPQAKPTIWGGSFGTFAGTSISNDPTVTLSATSGVAKATFSSAVYGISVFENDRIVVIHPKGFGSCEVIDLLSSTEATVNILIPFHKTDAIDANNYVIEPDWADNFNGNSGFPHTCTFHEGRLFFGGTSVEPMTLFASKVGDPFNFRPTEGLDDDAFQVTLTTDSVNTITALRSGRDLQIFTTGGEFFIPQADLDPITPSNVAVKSTTKRGAKPNIKPVATEGGTFFIQRQGKSLREFAFSDVELSYVSQNVSVLASHLIVDPLAMTIRPATDTTEGDLLMIVNGTSTTGYRSASSGLAGKLICYMINKQQNIVAPSFIETDGTFCDVAVDLDTTYVIVKRTINSATKYYLEVFDDDFTTDSSVQKTSSFSGTSYNLVSHLNAKTAKVIRDDIVESDVTVNSSGTITTSAQPTSYIEAGLDFTVEVITNPVEPRLPDGVSISQKKRILEATPLLYRTQNLTINGFEVPLQTLPYSAGGAVPTITGMKKMHGLTGYDTDAQLTISQSKPVFFTVLSVDFKLALGL